MGGPKIGIADASKRIFKAKITLKLAIHLPPSPSGLRRTSRRTSPVLALAGIAGRALVPFGAGVSRLGVQGCWFGPGRFYWAFARHVPGGGVLSPFLLPVVLLLHVVWLFGGRDVVVEQGWKVPLVDVGAHHAVDHFHRYQPVGWLDEFA